MSSQPPSSPATAEDLQAKKLALEVEKLPFETEKLRAELEVIQKPFRHPQARAALVTAAVALAFAGVQSYRYSNERVLAQIETARLAFGNEKLEKTRLDLAAETDRLTAEAERLEKKRRALEADTGRLTAVAEKLETKRRTLAADAKTLVGANKSLRQALLSMEAEFRGVQERLASTRLTREQLDGEVHQLREAIARAKSATSGPATASLTVSAGTLSSRGGTVFIGDTVTLTPSVSPAPVAGTSSATREWKMDFDYHAGGKTGTATPVPTARPKP